MPTATEHSNLSGTNTHLTDPDPIPAVPTWVGDKKVPVGLTKDGPSAVVFKEKLYIFYQGTRAGRLWYNTFEDNTWKIDDVQVSNCYLSSNPSAVVWNNLIYVFYQSSGDSGHLYYNRYDDNQGWLGEHQIEGTSLSSSPSAVVFGSQLYVFHQGSRDSGELWYNVTQKVEGKAPGFVSWDVKNLEKFTAA